MSVAARRARRGERGAFLVIFALCLLAVLTFVAFAVDLGNVRFQRRNNQQLTDLAAIAAGQFMAGYGGASGGVAASPFDACVAALGAVQGNANDFLPELTVAQMEAACDVFYDPEDGSGALCDSDDPNPPVLESDPITRGPYTVVIRHPVTDELIDDDRFQGGSGTNDGLDACARLQVLVGRTDETAFASVIGHDRLNSRANTVVKGTVDEGSKVIPAFLILERYKCGALGNSVGGDSLGIVVEAVGSQPGRIHVDSSATGAVPADCSNTTTSAGGVTTWATPLPSGDNSLIVEPAGAAPGVLSIVATGARASGGGGINVTPTPGEPVSRAPIDEAFRDPADPTQAAVAAMHSAARPEVASSANLATGTNGWLEVNCTLNPSAGDLADISATNWYVNCPGSFSPASPTVFTAPPTPRQAPTQIVFRNNVSVGNGQTFDTGAATKVVVRGSFSSAGTSALPSVQKFYVGDGLSVTNTGSLRVASASLPTIDPDENVASACAAENENDESNEIVVFFSGTGPSQYAMDIAGPAAFCETTVYLTGSKTATASYAPMSDTSTAIYGCSIDLPCPTDTTTATIANARWSITNLVEWTAPNQDTDTIPPDPRGREDLMFWSEGQRTSNVGGGGFLVSSGVFVSPNMRVEMRSPATASPRNAQFIARQLFLFQGTLQMRPLPNDSVPVPEPGSFTLIR